MHVIIDCVYCDGANLPSVGSHGAAACCCPCSSRAVGGIHLSLAACRFYCLFSPVKSPLTTSTTRTFIFPSKKKIYILFLPVSCNYCSWVHSGIPAPLTNNLYSVADLRGSQPPAFTASCCSPPGPPKGASPAPFPHCWGAGRGPNGGKQIIYKHFPKKKKKSSHTHTQMPPQVETHTIFEPMEEASSGRSCQEDQITFILPLFCLTDFLYGLLL